MLLTGGMGSAFCQAQVLNLVTLGTSNLYPAKLSKDVWGYAAGSREYALQTYVHGMSVLDVTNPANITEAAFVPAPETNWKTVKTYRNYAYLGADGGGTGLQIINLAGLPNSVRVLPNYTANGFASTHNIWIDTARALLYATGLNGQAFRILSLANPESPVQLYTNSIESHDFDTRGTTMYLSTARTRQVRIYNVANANAPQVTAIITFPSNPTLIHNTQLSVNGRYLFSTEEVVNTSLKVWDISTPTAATVVETYLAGNRPDTNIAHNVYNLRDTLYLSHYAQGFRMLDATDPLNLREIAYFRPTNYPSHAAGFYTYGAFNNYPHLPSRNILSSDADLGLFIFRFVNSTTVRGKADYRIFPFAKNSGPGIFALDGRRMRFLSPASRLPDFTRGIRGL